MRLCRAAPLACGRGALAQSHAKPAKSICRFGKIHLLLNYETISVVITKNFIYQVQTFHTLFWCKNIYKKIIFERRCTPRFHSTFFIAMRPCHACFPVVCLFPLFYWPYCNMTSDDHIQNDSKWICIEAIKILNLKKTNWMVTDWYSCSLVLVSTWWRHQMETFSA